MIGELYDYVSETIVGQVPMEFEFIIPIIVMVLVFLIFYVVFYGFIFIKDVFGGR